MDWITLLSYVRQKESSDLKFFPKISNVADMGPTISAMLNHKGGHIFLGMDNRNFHLIGTSFSKEELDSLCASFIQPSCQLDVSFINRLEKLVMVIVVPEGQEKPYYFNNICYVMEGAYPKSALLEKKPSYDEGGLKEVEDIDLNQEDLHELTSEISDLAHQFIQSDSDYSLEVNYPLNHRQSKSLLFLEKEGSISNKQYRHLFSVSHKTAHLELVDMVEKKYLRTCGQGRSTVYVPLRLDPSLKHSENVSISSFNPENPLLDNSLDSVLVKPV